MSRQNQDRKLSPRAKSRAVLAKNRQYRAEFLPAGAIRFRSVGVSRRSDRATSCGRESRPAGIQLKGRSLQERRNVRYAAHSWLLFLPLGSPAQPSLTPAELSLGRLCFSGSTQPEITSSSPLAKARPLREPATRKDSDGTADSQQRHKQSLTVRT